MRSHCVFYDVCTFNSWRTCHKYLLIATAQTSDIRPMWAQKRWHLDKFLYCDRQDASLVTDCRWHGTSSKSHRAVSARVNWALTRALPLHNQRKLELLRRVLCSVRPHRVVISSSKPTPASLDSPLWRPCGWRIACLPQGPSYWSWRNWATWVLIGSICVQAELWKNIEYH